MNSHNKRINRFCDELKIKDIDDFLKYSAGELLRVPNIGRGTVKDTLMYLVEKKIGERWMAVLWTAMSDKVSEAFGDVSWKD